MNDKKGQNIKVSVIMPSLNVVDYIESAVTSVLNQTLTQIEILCIDAGSSDGTYELLERLAAKDECIRLLKSPIKSYGYQVNMGLSEAVGEYIGILETDDYVDESMYEALHQVASDENLDYVKCDYDTYRTDNGGRRILTTRKISDNSLLYESVFAPSDYVETACDDWYLWNGIYKNSLIRDNDIRFSESRGAAFQDIGFLHQVSVKAKRVKYVNRSLYRYCIDRSDASSNKGGSIRFIRNEYGLLLDSVGDKCGAREWMLLYSRMGKSFTRAFMDCDEETLRDQETGNICRWFQRRLMDAENRGFFSEDVLPVGLRSSYHHLVDPVSGYVAYRKNRDREIKEFLGDGKMIVIFGCGKYGSEAHQYLTERGYDVAFFMDNSPKLWGDIIEGKNVLSPDDIEGIPKNSRFIIANEKHSSEIYEQLAQVIDKEREYIF